MISAESFVNSWKIRTNSVSDQGDYDRIRDAIENLSKAPIYIDDKPGNNILAMRAVARRLKRERGIGLIVVDYLQLMAPTNTKASDSMVQQVTVISRLRRSRASLKFPFLHSPSFPVQWSSAVANRAFQTSAIPVVLPVTP
jgi:replicative DNA helicase